VRSLIAREKRAPTQDRLVGSTHVSRASQSEEAPSFTAGLGTRRLPNLATRTKAHKPLNSPFQFVATCASFLCGG
jgi:hypothetical protein